MKAAARRPSQLVLETAWAGLGGGLVAVLLIGAVETLLGVRPGSDFVPAFGLLAWLAVPLSLLGCLWTLALHGPSRLPWLLLLESAKRRQRLLLLGPALLLAWFVVAQSTSLAFSQGSWPARRLGFAVALGSVVLLAAGSAGLDALSTWLGRKYQRPSLWLCVALLLTSVPAGTWLLVHIGTPSGVGSPLALFGVLARDELSLAAALSLSACLGGGYVGAWLGLHFALGWRARLTIACLLLAAGVGFGVAWRLPSAAGLRFEREQGLASRLLALAQGLTDRDHDGVAGAFGGGDCDDTNPLVSPGAIDSPGDGLDQDCSGADAVAVARAAPTSAPALEQAPAQLPARANVLLLTIDTLRYDLGFTRPAGSRSPSPHLDALAQRSTVFERAYSLASYTSKSLGPALIGRYPSETARNFDHFDRFAPTVPFIQERLQKAGVRTVSVQGYWYFYFKGYGFERGWDALDTSAAPKQISVDADASSNGDKVADRTIAALEQLGADPPPFFLWSHWVDPHAEYVAHADFDFGKEPRQRYDGEVAFVDAQVGRILDALAKSPLAARTLVIVTSDHGEAFGEHGMIRHGFELWEELVRVPLLVYVPGQKPSKVSARRSAIDLVPTLLEIFGQPLPSGDDFLRGKSWLADLAGAAQAERPILVDMPQGPHNKQRRAFLSGKYKLITGDGRVLGLYDLDADPAEKHDLSEDKTLLGRVQDEQSAYLSGLRPLGPQR